MFVSIIRFLISFFLFAIGIGIYLIYHYSKELPDYSQLKAYHPPSITRIYSSDGKLIQEYAKEHRIFVPISNIPKSLIEAFIAAEDKNFYDHQGIDIPSILRALVTNVGHLINQRKMEGASTIPQQVVKNFLLTSERSIERKIKEAILSYMISQVFTKDQILELYLNQIYLGKGAYGVAAAALRYFNKSIEELNLNESALLASLPKAPSKFNPEKNYERATQRKNYVLSRMRDDGYISEELAKETMKLPIILKKQSDVEHVDANYYADKVREEVINIYGSEYFYTAGLTVITCMDSKLQKNASRSLENGIINYDRRSSGYRGAIKKIPLDNWQQALSTLPLPINLKNDILSVVLEVTNKQIKLGFKNGDTYSLSLKDAQASFPSIKSFSSILKAGDVIAVKEQEQNKYILSQLPAVNGAIMVIEPSSGKVLAAEGGYDYSTSKFDRTTQAYRQPGSAIKTFIHLAAIENGIQPNDIFDDSPVEVELGYGLPNWKPKNYENNFLGPMTLRKGLERSRNTITVRVSQKVGVKKVTEVIKRFGINDNPVARPSIVLGASETTLERMTVAYGIIANKGYKITPHYIELIKDRNGNVIYRRDESECDECRAYRVDDAGEPKPPIIPVSKSTMIVDEASSYQITSILSGAVQRGTGRRAASLNKVIAGKTGTTNDSMDAWFIGYTPRIVVGTYIGHDNPKTLGKKGTGASIALPIFVDFMQNAYDIPSIDFIVPESINLVKIDYDTGKESNSPNAILEAFKKTYYPDQEEKIDIIIPNPSKLKKLNEHNNREKHEDDPFKKIDQLPKPKDSSQELY
jgi:penicillin-binding protein 1A